MIEIEAKSEADVKTIASRLGFDYSKAIFGPITIVYHQKYGISEEIINNQIPLITFSSPNPFI